MKCPICAKQTLPGAKLCGPCRAALKRARDDSVWEIPGSTSAASPDEARAAVRPPARWVLGSGRLAGWRGWTLGLLGVALCIVAGALVTRTGEAAKASTGMDSPAVAPAAPLTAQPVVPSSALVDAKVTFEPPSPSSAPPREPATQPPRHEPAHRRIKPLRQKPEPPAAPATPMVQSAPPIESPPPAPPPAPEPAPPPVDRWQQMSAALARCGTEDLFGRIGCDLRVRTSFCDGYWGEVPQCPGAIVNDHGQ